MKTHNNMNRFSVWGVAALGLVVAGALLTRVVDAQEKPMHISGAGVLKAFEAGNPGQTMERMRAAYDALKANDWDFTRVPPELLQTPDQKFAETESMRNAHTTAFAIPSLGLYREVALYCDLYERKNIVQYSHRTLARPEGFWLVMYKDGTLAKYRPEEIRMYPHPTIPDAQVPVFPGMSVYKAALPKLPYCK